MLQAVSRPWLKNYPPGVSADVDASGHRSLVDLLEESFRRYAARDAAQCMGASITYGELDDASAAFGAWLQSRAMAPGSRVAVMLPNIPPCMVAIAAVLRAGHVVVNVNPLYTARELRHQLVDAGAEAIVLLENCAKTLSEVIDEMPSLRHVVLVSAGDMLGFWRGSAITFAVRHLRRMVPAFELPLDRGRTVTRYAEALRAGSRSALRRADRGPDDIAFLQYTGGTTGTSKGAMLLHRNVVANILQTEEWFKPMLSQRAERQLVTVCALPLYHIFALTCCYLFGARQGMLNLLIPNPRDIPRLVRALQGRKIHMFPGVNTLFNALVHDPDFARLDFSELAISNGGGMPVQQATARHWLRITGCPIIEGYGLSETSPVVTVNRPDITEFTGNIGLPIPSTDVCIRDDDGRDVSMGEPGEICIRGPQVMAGYWNRPEETAAAMTADGFFRSGDVGVMDEGGFFRIVDRKKDMILVSGFNVYPSEIEQVVHLHPGVLECAAVGVPDAHSGEAVKLFVVKQDPALSEEELLGHCARHLAAYKRPRHVEFRDELPKSNVGKILRRQLRG